MEAPVIYIATSEHSAFIAEAIRGAFARAVVLESADVKPGLIKTITDQDVAVILLCFGGRIRVWDHEQKGLAVYPRVHEGEKIHDGAMVFDEEPRDDIVEAVLRELKKRKILLPLI